MSLHVSGTEPKKGRFTIGESFDPKLVGILFYGIPILLLLLSIPFAFFRHLFNFSSMALAVLFVLSALALVEDDKNGIKRDRPKKKDFKFPTWFRIMFFIVIILVSAGLRYGYYVTPLAWIVIWICLENDMRLLEKSWRN